MAEIDKLLTINKVELDKELVELYYIGKEHPILNNILKFFVLPKELYENNKDIEQIIYEDYDEEDDVEVVISDSIRYNAKFISYLKQILDGDETMFCLVVDENGKHYEVLAKYVVFKNKKSKLNWGGDKNN